MLLRNKAVVVLALFQLRMISTKVNSSNVSTNKITYLGAQMAKNIDEKLMNSPGFSIDQLMELAGFSVAAASVNFMFKHTNSGKIDSKRNVLVVCGPGNNGGDGLVAARHLKHFGWNPEVFYPKRGKTQLFQNLVQQMFDLDIPVHSDVASIPSMQSYSFAIDAMFGFSFSGPPREPFASIIQTLSSSQILVVSVDIPSGWDVEAGDIHSTGFMPHAVVSLTAPKLCMRDFPGVHYVGGRFVPPKLAQEFGLVLPDYGFGSDQYVLLSAGQQDLSKREAGDAQIEEHEPISAMFVTAPSSEEAQRIARELLQRGLAACVNLVPQVQSLYMWEGKLESAQEVLMMIKTRRSLVQAVTEAVTALHAYEVPESIAVQVAGGSEAYLAWVRQSTALGAAAATPAAAVSTSTATAAVGSLVTSTDGVGLEPHNVP